MGELKKKLEEKEGIAGKKEENEEEAIVLTNLCDSMSELKSEMTMNGTLHSLRSLAHHHLPAVLDEILTSPVPHPP